jgi:tetratricopeptide (TPR) repeat protein
MPGRDDSSWRAGGAGRWLAVQQVVWAVAAVGVLAVAAPGQQTSDPAVARVLRELQAWEGDPVTIASAQARAGDPAAARATLQRAIAHATNARDLLAMEQVQAEMGDRDAALKTLLMARNSNLAGPQPGPDQGPSVNGRVAPPDPDLAARVANRQIPETLTDITMKMGDAAEASRMAGAIGKTERNWKLLILTVIAESHAEIGDPANRKVWEDALRAAETGTQKVRVLLKIAEAQVYAGDREAALRTSEQALVAERNMNREELERGPLLNRDFLEARIAVLRAEAGDITGAIRLANTIKHIQVQGDALARISAVQAASGDIKGALETAGAIRPPDPTQGWITDLSDQWYAMPKIITAQARAGDVASALATADRLGPSREARLDALISIAEGLHQRNEMGKRAQPPRGP